MACSVFRSNVNPNIIGRSFDFFYNRSASIVIKTEAIPGKRFASIGTTGGLGVLTQKDIINNNLSEDYKKAIPCLLVDGLNENHVFIEENIITTGQFGLTDNFNPGKPRMSINHLVRPVLDKAKTAKDAVKIIADYDVYIMEGFKGVDETHYFIADLNDTYVIEWIGPKNTYEKTTKMVYRGTSEIEELKNISYIEYVPDFINSSAIMTNFYLYDWNKEIPSLPVTQDYLDQSGSLGKWTCGLERYKTILNGLDSVVDNNSCIDLLKQIRYTHAYTNDAEEDKFWWTELTGPFKGPEGQDMEINLTTPHDNELYQKYIKVFKQMFIDRDKDVGDTWESCHQAAFDIQNLTMTVVPHETGKLYNYYLN